MAITFSSRFKRTLITYLLAFVCLGVVFGINLGLNILRDALQAIAEKSSELSGGILVIIMIIGICSSLVVAVNNIILTKIIRVISKYERHETYTKYNVSVALKLTFSMFINTGIIPLVINLGSDNWFGYGGLVVDIFLIMLTINFVTPLTNLFDIEIFLKKFLICIEKRKGDKSTMTQRSANELYEGPNFDVAMRYALVMMVLMMTAFYTPLIPIIPIISFFGSILVYWTEKLSLLRINKIPEEFAEEMSLVFTGMIPFLCFLYALGQFIFINSLSEGQNQLTQIILWISVASWLLPVSFLFHKCEGSIIRDDNETYQKNKTKFLNDYDRSNPITSKEATLRHLLDLENEEKSEEKKIELEEQRLRILHNDNFGNLIDYADNKKMSQSTSITSAKLPSEAPIQHFSLSFLRSKIPQAQSEMSINQSVRTFKLPPINSLRKVVPFEEIDSEEEKKIEE